MDSGICAMHTTTPKSSSRSRNSERVTPSDDQPARKLSRHEMGSGNLTGVGSLSLCARSFGATASSCTG
eukprot:scaffold32490_cov58-Phaeocystis_antarctica.AAC.5